MHIGRKEGGLFYVKLIEIFLMDSGKAEDANRTPVKFPMKKSSKLKLKQLKKGKFTVKLLIFVFIPDVLGNFIVDFAY